MAWLGTWAYRRKMTVDSSKVDSTVSDFPTEIPISAAAGLTSVDLSAIFTEISYANRKKIAVTTSDGTTQCYVEIENWDVSGELALLHANIPSILSSSDTDLYFYYDSAQSDNTTYVGDPGSVVAQSVWDSNFSAVYHMNQDPSGGAGSILDSTDNNNDGTPQGSMLTGDLIDGHKGGMALDFDGGDDYILVPDSASLVFGNASIDEEFSIEILVSFDVLETLILIGKEDATANREWSLYYHLSDFWLACYDLSSAPRIARRGEGATITTTGTYYYLASSYDASEANTGIKLFIDDSADVGYTNDDVGGYTAMHNTDAGINIGCADSGSPDLHLNGKIGEVRISGTQRSDAWLKATYHSLFDELLTWGAEETEPIGGQTGLLTLSGLKNRHFDGKRAVSRDF